MATLQVGFLLCKRVVNYKTKEYKVYEIIDFVAGSMYRMNDKNRCSIITGKLQGCAMHCLGDENADEDLCFLPRNLEKAIEENDGHVNFVTMRENNLSLNWRYYLLKNYDLIPIKDEALIKYLDSTKKNTVYDEDFLSSGTDISRMYNSIKQTIISQDEQIMQILTALFKNQTVINSNLDSDLIAKLKENIIVYGPTGTGKTEILKRISKLYNIPIVIEDATSLSEVGYVGRNVTDMLQDLYMAANKDLKLAQRGILVIDEFDKLAEKDGTKTHVSRFGVQRALLKILDGSEIYFDNIKFDTSKLTIVALGAFTGITSSDEYGSLTTADFEKFGILRELMGRFSKTIAMKPLGKEDIIQILTKSDFSPLNTYKELFKTLNVDFTYDDEFVEYIAELAIAKNSGARSIKTVFDNEISGALFRIFAGEYSAIKLVKPQIQGGESYILTEVQKKN